MKCDSPVHAEIEQVANCRRPDLPLFHYTIRRKCSGDIVLDGVAADMHEAIDSVNAWFDFLKNAAAA